MNVSKYKMKNGSHWKVLKRIIFHFASPFQMLSLFHVFLEFQLTNIIFSIYANFFYTMPSCLVLFTITMAHFLQRRRGDLGAHRKRRNFLKVRIFQSIETFNRNFVLLLLLILILLSFSANKLYFSFFFSFQFAFC